MTRQTIVTLDLEGTADVALHLLLPAGARAAALRWDGAAAGVTTTLIGESPYADARGRTEGRATVEVTYG